jgi:hypothetical protein
MSNRYDPGVIAVVPLDGCVIETMINAEMRKAELGTIVETYFRQKKDVEFATNVELQGQSKKWKLDYVLTAADGGRFGVMIKDWDRTLGINQIRQIQKACYDIPLDGGIIISNAFSPSAVSYAKRYGISCYSRYELLAKL